MSDDSGNEAVGNANEIIESEVANVLIEIQMAKAARIGVMLRIWRGMMVGDGGGVAFPEEWVDQAAWRLFEEFYPPIKESNGIIAEIE